MGKANGIYKRSDNRWEARYKKGVSPEGKTLYGAVYGATREEAEEKRRKLIGEPQEDKKVPAELNLIILGAGSHGRDVYELASSLRIFRKISFLDDKLEGENIVGKCKDALSYKNEYPCAFVAIGDNKIRKKWAKFLKERNFLIPSLVSPAAVVSSNAKIGEGVIVLPQSNIGAAEIGDFCIISANSTINSKAILEAYCHVGSGGIVLKNANVPEGSMIDSGEIFGK